MTRRWSVGSHPVTVAEVSAGLWVTGVHLTPVG
jgi:hypothetical protein